MTASSARGTPADFPSRRRFAGTLGRLGLGLAVLPMLPRRAAAAGKITYFTWSGYEIPQLHQVFLDKYGADAVTATFFANLDEALQKLIGGFKPDISHPCVSNIDRWREAGVSRPIDVSRLRNWPDVWDSLKSIGEAQHDGQYWFVPFDWGNVSILYRTDLVPAPEETWKMLFDERYKGKLSSYDSFENAIVAAVAAGVKDPFKPTEEDFARVAEMLRKQRDLVRFYWSDQTTVEQALAAGEVVATYAWNSSLSTLRKQGVPVAYMHPKEGVLTWVCGLAITNDSPEVEEERYAFIDAMLEPSAGKYMIEEYGYGHANRRSFELASQARLSELGLEEPEAFLSKGMFFRATDEATRQRYIKIFEEAKAL